MRVYAVDALNVVLLVFVRILIEVFLSIVAFISKSQVIASIVYNREKNYTFTKLMYVQVP